MIQAANTVTYDIDNDDGRLKKEKVSNILEVMLSPNKKIGIVLLAIWVVKLCGLQYLVDLRSKVGTISTAFFADMMYECSHPFNEKAHVETDLSLCTTSPPNLITYNVLMTCMTCTTNALLFILLFVSIFLEFCFLYCTVIFL